MNLKNKSDRLNSRYNNWLKSKRSLNNSCNLRKTKRISKRAVSSKTNKLKGCNVKCLKQKTTQGKMNSNSCKIWTPCGPNSKNQHRILRRQNKATLQKSKIFRTTLEKNKNDYLGISKLTNLTQTWKSHIWTFRSQHI